MRFFATIYTIIHESYTTIAAYLKKMHVYTTLDAQDMHNRGTHRSGRVVKKSFIIPYTLGIRQAIKLLFYKKGMLDGWQGVVWSILSAYYEFKMGRKYLAPRHSGLDPESRQSDDVDPGSEAGMTTNNY